MKQLNDLERLFNEEIVKTIISVGAVDTGEMRDSTFCRIELEGDFGYNILVDSTEYYKFVDEGTRHITPREITDKTLSKSNVEEAMGELTAALIDKYIDELNS